MLDLRKYIETRGWTQRQAAAIFGESQPRISNLMKGNISRFSVDKLINMLTRAGDASRNLRQTKSRLIKSCRCAEPQKISERK